MKISKIAKLLALLLSLALLVLVAGCDLSHESDKYSGSIVNNSNEQVGGSSQNLENNPEKSGNQQPEQTQSGHELATKIYFSDAQEMYLAAEDLVLNDVNDLQEAAQKVITALIAGPKDSSLLPTIPSGTRVLGVEVDNKLAAVNFSAELRDNHSGGSSGETMTIYSIVNSLAELEGIDQVQILVEGQVIETLAGHISLDEPLEPDWDLVK